MSENKELLCAMYSKNFSEIELRDSWIARNKNIKNYPDETQKANLRKLCKNILQPIRDKWNDVIIVNSGYRCKELNDLVGGVQTSEHLTGNAADVMPKKKEDVRKLFDFIKEMVENGEITVGQLILEHSRFSSWVHVSNPSKKHKNEILVIKKQIKRQPH